MRALKSRLAVLVAGLSLIASIGCGKDENGSSSGGSAATSSYKADADGLKSLFSDIRAAATSGNENKAAAMARALLPDAASIKKALKDDAGDAVAKIASMHEKLAPKNDTEAAKVFAGRPEQSEVQVHASTTEALAKYERDTPAFMEFPGGARRAAETILRPGMTFYEVELVKPGEKRGIKFHLLFHDGSSWKMLGPVWRALR